MTAASSLVTCRARTPGGIRVEGDSSGALPAMLSGCCQLNAVVVVGGGARGTNDG